jgi:hypothetical protein
MRRLPAILEWRITLDNQRPPISCTIRDLSAAGARLWVPREVVLPCEFELEIPRLQQSLKVRVVWSKAQTHGVMFLEELRAPAGEDVTVLLRVLGAADHSSPQPTSPGRSTALSSEMKKKPPSRWRRLLARRWRHSQMLGRDPF